MKCQQFILILSLFSSTLCALGLGEIKLRSYLNEPFLANVYLIDAAGIAPANIKVNLGSFEDYEKLDLPRDPVLQTLQLRVTHDTTGQPIIRIQSETRIQTPYLVLLINLTWPHGEIFHTYTILLDPPHYGLKPKTKSLAPWLAHQKAETISPDREASPTLQTNATYTTYGPTLVNESIWQIAKRYKLENLTLPQIVLGLVGENPEAFEAGNLNGLKPASLLNIPHSVTLIKISKNLAAQEVEVHDIAWRTHSPIHHVLPPPYLPTEYHDTSLTSEVPSFYPLVIDSKIPTSPLFTTQKTTLTETQLSLETKLKTLEETNLQLIQTLRQKEQENQHLRKEIQRLTEQLAQLKQRLVHHQTYNLPLWLRLLMLVAIIAGFMGWLYRRKIQAITEPSPIEDVFVPPPPPEQHTAEPALKNPKALQALLELAKTYLSKGETEAAKQALEEVMQYGNEKQKIEAQALINKPE